MTIRDFLGWIKCDDWKLTFSFRHVSSCEECRTIANIRGLHVRDNAVSAQYEACTTGDDESSRPGTVTTRLVKLAQTPRCWRSRY